MIREMSFKCLIFLTVLPRNLFRNTSSYRGGGLSRFDCIYQFAKFGDLTSCGSKDIFKNAPCLMY